MVKISNIKKHNEIRKKHERAGSRFSVRQIKETFNHGQIKILVVDDESRMRKLVKDFLVKAGYDVIEAGDGEQAVDTFYAQKDIALIILDVMMPKNGRLAGLPRNPPELQSPDHHAHRQKAKNAMNSSALTSA